jgi:hypothetical protein
MTLFVLETVWWALKVSGYRGLKQAADGSCGCAGPARRLPFGSLRLSAPMKLQIQPLNGHFVVRYKFSRTSQPLYSIFHTNQPPAGPICQPLLFSPSFPGLSLLPILCSSAQPPERRRPALPPSWRRKELLEVAHTGSSRSGAPSSSHASARLLSFPRWSTPAWPGVTSSSAPDSAVPALSGGGAVEAGDRSRRVRRAAPQAWPDATPTAEAATEARRGSRVAEEQGISGCGASFLPRGAGATWGGGVLATWWSSATARHGRFPNSGAG